MLNHRGWFNLLIYATFTRTTNYRVCNLHIYLYPTSCRHSINNFNNISLMNDRLRSMEYEMTNRISNIEALLHQQQRFQSIPHLGMHPATNGYGMNPYQLYPGAQYPLNPIHPHGYPTVRPTHINPMSYQGYPIIPVDLAHVHQYSNLPRVNLPFQSEHLPQNPPQGHPLGIVPQVQVHVPIGQAQMHHNLQRANLEFRNGNNMHSSREYNSSASMRPNRSNVKHPSQQNTTSRSTTSVDRTRSGEHVGQEAPLCVSNKDEIQTDLTSASKSGPAGGDSCSLAPNFDSERERWCWCHFRTRR